MLTTLRVRNLALVTDLTLELRPGYNVITGETGAGKSIIIGALNLVLGERADRTLIRSGEESCSVEAMFEVGVQASACFKGTLKRELQQFLEENGLEACEDGQLVLKRTFSANGANRQFVNGSPTTIGTLTTIGEWLVDIHGPHDHQSLLNPTKQLLILDAFGGLEGEREAFGDLVRRRMALAAEKSALIVDEKTYAQQLDLLRFQVQEITAARLQPGEDEQEGVDFNRASKAAKLLQLSQAAAGVLSESDQSLLTQAGAVGRMLQELHRMDSGASALEELHVQAVGTLRDLQAALSRYAEKVDVDPAKLAELEERLDLIHSLKRKYGSSLDEVISFGEEAKRKLQSLEGRDVELSRINAELAKLDSEILKAGQSLSSKRRKIIPQLAKAVSKQLQDLGFKQARFDANLTTDSAGDETTSLKSGDGQSRPTSSPAMRQTGFDQIEFQFAPNPGEPAKSLRAIASSGELARVMLALKTVLAAEDEIPVLIFDEVDANVGGETAHAVGGKMKQIAARRQVLCITHLPQVAAPADAHYLVDKQIKNGRTISEIQLLDKKERVTELARMLGGQSDAARKHAEALLK